MSYQSLPAYKEDDASVGGEDGLLLLGVRQDAEGSAVSANGDYHAFIFNEYGRLKVAAAPAQYTPIDGSISAIQASPNTPVANATVFANVSQISNVIAYVTGTFSGMNCIFEGSIDSTNGTDGYWFTIQAVQTNANTIATTTGALSAAPVYAWEMSVNALAYVRVRCTARTSGTQNWRLTLGTYATEPIPAVQVSGTQPVSGSLTSAGTTTATPASGTGIASVTAATTNATSVKATAGNLYEMTLSNVTATPAYVKLYNKASAPTVGTDVPIATIAVPANTTLVQYFGPVGKRFSTGIAYAITGAAPATDTTAFVVGMQVSGTYI